MKKIIFYMKAQWQGELPFGISYFLNFYFLTVSYRFATYFAIPAMGWDEGRANRFAIMWIVLLGIYLMIWGVVGVIRAAKKIHPQSRGLAALFGFLLVFNTLKYYFALFGGGINPRWY